jgi:hypothetical protein
MDLCTFTGNSAQGGEGAERGLGKGGALFVETDEPAAPFTLAMLGRQTWSGNLAEDPLEDPSFDNDDYYLSQAPATAWRGSALKERYKAYLRAKVGP